MRNEWKISMTFFAGGVISWIIDVAVDPCFKTMPLKTLFWCGSSKHDIFMRSYMFAAFLLFGATSFLIVSRHSAAREALANAHEKISKLTSGTLSGLLPICSYCKRIRDNAGRWIKIETYIEQHSSAEFTHGICPDCEKKI